MQILHAAIESPCKTLDHLIVGLFFCRSSNTTRLLKEQKSYMYMWELARYVFAQNTIQLLHFLYKSSLLPWLFVTFQIHYYCDMGTIFIIQTIYVILHKVFFILTAKFSFSGFHFRLPKGNSEKSWALSTEELDFHAMNSPGHKNDTIKFWK